MNSNIITIFGKKITIKLFNLKTMNYSTLKKTVAFSFASLMAVGIANAQTDSTKAAAKSTDTTKMSSAATTAKVFGGTKQYNTFSIGINGGVTAPSVATGGVNNFNHNQPNIGYGISLRDQLSHAFGLQIDVRGGNVKGSDNAKFENPGYTVDSQTGDHIGSFKTKFYQATLSGVINVGSLSFLHRTNGVNFFLNAGAGLAWYQPKTYSDNNQ